MILFDHKKNNQPLYNIYDIILNNLIKIQFFNYHHENKNKS